MIIPRSSDCLSLVVPKIRTVLLEQAFLIAGLNFWNSLPASVCSAWPLVLFQSQLKTLSVVYQPLAFSPIQWSDWY